MFAVLDRARKLAALGIALLATLVLASCDVSTSSTGPRIDTSRPVPVALLVPGGSESATDTNLAQSLENAARLAMSELDGVTIDLRVYNTAGNAATASSVAQQAVQDGAKIILGPVYAENAAAAGIAARARGVNVLAFSNNPGVAGGNVFILGNTFQNTANRMVSYAASQNRGNILIVHGQSAAEELGRDAILRAISANPGANQSGVTSFEVSQNGVIDALPEISAAAKSSDANAILFTSGTDGALSFVTSLLPENGIKTTEYQYMGLQRWDIPSNALTLPGVQGGWFALPDPNLTAQFGARYQAAYGEAPHTIAGLAYDGIAAIGALVKAGKSDALTGAALTQPQGFVGVNGVFRLLSNGTNERGLAVAQIQNNQPVVIDPAPRSFSGVGF